MSEDDVHRAVAKYRERYHDVGLFENNVYAGVPEMLAVVSASEPLAVATSKPTYSATRILEHFNLAQYFDVIGGSELDGTRIHKEQVVAYSLSEMRGRGVASAPVMVGDREHDVLGAATHDVPCIGVMWGYGSREELEAAGTVAVADTVSELQDMLLSR
jgi:phosphoglycolate phosphatase